MREIAHVIVGLPCEQRVAYRPSLFIHAYYGLNIFYSLIGSGLLNHAWDQTSPAGKAEVSNLFHSKLYVPFRISSFLPFRISSKLDEIRNGTLLFRSGFHPYEMKPGTKPIRSVPAFRSVPDFIPTRHLLPNSYCFPVKHFLEATHYTIMTHSRNVGVACKHEEKLYVCRICDFTAVND